MKAYLINYRAPGIINRGTVLTVNESTLLGDAIIKFRQPELSITYQEEIEVGSVKVADLSLSELKFFLKES